MALSTILRRTASSLLPRTIRSVATQRKYYSPVFSTPLSNTIAAHPTTFHSALNFSSLSKLSKNDQNLLGIIETEIGCAVEDYHKKVVDTPKGFPFEIQDDPGEQVISLVRRYQGEDIQVIVHVPQGLDCQDDSEENKENDEQPCIPLVVSVSKGKNQPCLEFGCTAYPDEVTIDSLTVKDPTNNSESDDLAYEGPEFSDLDEKLQEGFVKYLEERGIKPSTTNFLYEYMEKKDDKEYLLWLKNIKSFVEK